MFYQVLLPIASDPLTYSHDDILEEGQLVVVCLRGKNVVGMIVGNLPPATDSFKVKKITKLLDIAPIKSIMRSFMLWVSSYNMIPLGSVFKMLVGVLGAGSYRQIQSKLEEKIVTDALKLSEAQLRVVNEICTDLDRYNPCLLQGVTGSGKTEVYLEIAKRVIMRSGQVLVLLPEILLSTQLADRFERHISNCAVWHSGVTQKKKLDIWMQTQTGSIKFVVGPRSALYLPFLNLKLIVVDEEHDTSFKQEEKQVYNARDMAVVRAKMEEATIVLSSATPSIESLYNVRRSVYRYFKLNTRYSGVEQPLVKVVDMKNQSAMQPATRALLHPITLQEIQSTLDKNKQVLLFMNRRGYATIAFCLNCSEKISCRNCHASLVYHKKTQL